MNNIIKSLALSSIVLLSSSLLKAQNLFIDNKGKVSFFSKTVMEDIDAANKTASSILNTKTGEVVALVQVKNFEFKNALMKEHFNENYLESEKYPKAAFKGTIADSIDYSKTGVYTIKAIGKLAMHGVEREETITGTLTVQDNNIKFSSKFNVKLVDYNITIPKIVFQKIAEVIEVVLDFNYTPKK